MIAIASVVVGLLGVSDPPEVRVPDRSSVIAEALNKEASAFDAGEFSLLPHQALTFMWDESRNLIQERYHYVESVDLAVFERSKLQRDEATDEIESTGEQRVVYGVARLEGVSGFEVTEGASVTLQGDGLVEFAPTPIIIKALGRNITIYKTGLEVLLDLQLPEGPLGLGSEWLAVTPNGDMQVRVTDTFVLDGRPFYEIEYQGDVESKVLFTEAGVERAPLEGSSEGSDMQLQPGASPMLPPNGGQPSPSDGADLSDARYCVRHYSVDRRGTAIVSFSTPFIRVSEKTLWTWQIPFIGGVAPVSMWSDSTTYLYSPEDAGLVAGYEREHSQRVEVNQ